jgi:tetratricopeptide (TPR) repeat protein/DNA-binding SARP family transcriptional activator
MNSDHMNETSAQQAPPLAAAYGELEQRFVAEADLAYDPRRGWSEILRKAAQLDAESADNRFPDDAGYRVKAEVFDEAPQHPVTHQLLEDTSNLAGQPVRFGLLGAFAVLNDDRPVEVEGPTARAVLAALLLRPTGYSGADQLISAVWGRPNGSSEDNLYHYISRLRRMLAPLGLSIGSGHVPRVRYRLLVPDSAVDARRFEQLLGSARTLGDTEPEEALNRLRAALSLWRGPRAFPELQLAGVRALGHRLDAARLDAEERLTGMELRCGDPERLVDRLRGLVAEYPDHAGIASALLRTLHATGRADEAEQVYRRAAQGHGPRLPAKIEHAHRDRAGAPRPGLGAPPAGRQVPDQVPAVARYFTGRVDELTRLLMHDDAGVAVSVVNGMPGVGKTALVLRAARQMVEAGRFPDGALFLDLRGFSSQAPLDPSAALDALLHGLGVPGAQIPAETDARAALYRTVVARRRVLIVLDNADDEAQVRPLLPGTASSLVLVTSRRRLAGLDDADQINIDILPTHEASRLFRAVVGPQRDPGDEHTVEQIVLLCGLLPLAVRIAAARLKTTRALTGHGLLSQLRTEQGRLTVLDDGERSVKAALAVSYRHLRAEQQRTFAALGLHPGLEFEPYATAALLDTSPEHARRLLEALEQVNLLDQPISGRYRFQDLIRTYAATHTGTNRERQAMLDQLYRYYAGAASATMDILYPFEADQRPRPPDHSPTGPNRDGEAATLAWIDAELDNMLAAAHHAADHGRPDHTIHQSGTLHRHLRTQGRYADAHTLHQHAVDASRANDNTIGEMHALTALGYIHRLQGHYGPATTCLQQAIDLTRTIDNVRGEIDALIGLGQVRYVQGAHAAAADCFKQALALARGTGNPPGELNALIGLGHIYYLQGRQDPATDCFQRALDLACRTANRPGELEARTGLAYLHYSRGQLGPAEVGFGRILELARSSNNHAGELNALTGLGHIHRLRGRYGPAADHYRQVLELAQATGDRAGELNALTGLGHIHRLQGRPDSAADSYTQVLRLARATGDRNYQLDAYLGLGRAHDSAGDPDRALDAHAQALQLARELGQRPDEVRALDGLAHIHQTLGHPEQARQLWRHALQILADLDTPSTDDVTTDDIQASLADLDTTTEPPQAADALRRPIRDSRNRLHPVRQRDLMTALVGPGWPNAGG